jgi:hypothetical protein
MNRPLKTVLFLVASVSVITMPIVSLAAPERGSFGASPLRSSHAASSGQSSAAPQFSHSSPASLSSSFNLGSANALGRRVESPGRLQAGAIQPLSQSVPNVRLNRVPTSPAATQINRNVIRRINPNVISPSTGQTSLTPAGQAHLPSAVIKPDVKLTAGAQSLVNNLANKDQILKLKKDFPAIQEKINLGALPKLQQAQNYALKSLYLSPKCAWWVPWYYYCYWPTCPYWCWDYWYPCHFYVIHCHAGYSYYFGAELFAVPGIGLGVASVNPGSPAERAGLVVGDMILSANGRPLQALNSNDVMRHVIQTSGGVLNMEVLQETSSQPVVMTAFLRRVYHYSY